MRLVYTAGSLALACLELLVNIDYERTFSDYVAIPVEFDDDLVLRVPRASLPDDWQGPNALPRTRAIGDAWVTRGSSTVLEVPSRVVPEESNYLLNPEHPEFANVRIGQPRAFRFDSGLVEIPYRPQAGVCRSAIVHSDDRAAWRELDPQPDLPTRGMRRPTQAFRRTSSPATRSSGVECSSSTSPLSGS